MPLVDLFNALLWAGRNGLSPIHPILGISSVTRSLVLAGHLLYSSRSHEALRSRSRDMSGANMVLWPGTCPARPGLGYATAWDVVITSTQVTIFFPLGVWLCADVSVPVGGTYVLMSVSQWGGLMC